MVKEWKEIHKDFGKSWGEHLKEQWKNNNFDYHQTNTWINVAGLEPKEYNFAWWLVDQQNKTPEQGRDSWRELKETYSELERQWKSIHQSFSSNQIIDWIKSGFEIKEVEQWVKIGLTPEESSFADYLKKRGYEPLTVNIVELRKEYYDAQTWLDKTYPLEQRANIKKINIGGKRLERNLKIVGFTNLEELHCYDNQLISLDCSDCSQLKIVRCQKNNLINLNLTNCPNIIEFYCNRNQLANLDFLNGLSAKKLEILLVANNNFSTISLEPFSKFINLKNLGLGNWFKESNNRFTGSLAPLKNLTKLEELDIAGLEVVNGLEHLPSAIQIFYCSAGNRNKAEVIAEELRECGEPSQDDDGDENFANPLRIWQEFRGSPAQQWLDENYAKVERVEITYLDISKKNLVGALKLAGFTNLVKLNCSKNQLTNLNLSDCPNLVILDCSENKLSDLYFLKPLGRLEHLLMFNNQKLSSQSLRFLIWLPELKELNANNCPWEGNLKPLENLNKLEILRIGNTNIEEGLEYLPTNCKKIYCNSDYNYKSIKIVKELDNSKCSETDKVGNRYYNLDGWREDKQNNAIFSVMPLERLFVIRSNIKRFINKWGIKETPEENNLSWYNTYLSHAKVAFGKLGKLWINQEKNNLTELSQLQSPEQFNKHWYWTIPQWGGRGAVGIGGVLSFFYNYDTRVITVASPVIETITSYAKKNWYETKEKQWNEFMQDCKELLDNYHELLGILKMIKSDGSGQLSKTLVKLEKTTKKFLNKYDNDQNGNIDVFELQKSREELAQDLNKESKWVGSSKLERMVRLMKRLEEKLNEYGQGKLSKESSSNDKVQELAWMIIDRLAEYSGSDFDAEKVYNDRGKEGNYWKEKATWAEYLKEITEEDIKEHGFDRFQENLLYPLIEIMLEKLRNINAKELELFVNLEESEKKLSSEFIKKIEDLCALCQESKKQALSEVIIRLKNKISKFSNHLTERSIDNKKDQIVIEAKEEERKLDKIVELIRNLEEEIVKDKENQLEENQALIEIPLE